MVSHTVSIYAFLGIIAVQRDNVREGLYIMALEGNKC